MFSPLGPQKLHNMSLLEDVQDPFLQQRDSLAHLQLKHIKLPSLPV